MPTIPPFAKESKVLNKVYASLGNGVTEIRPAELKAEMSITAGRKNELLNEYRVHGTDTGSSQVQIAVLTERIRNITEHLKKNKKDYAGQRGLLRLVGRRNTLLRYLARTNRSEYVELIGSLGLRK